MLIVEAKDLALGYDGRALVSDLNFKINGGEFVSVVGENGSGKSTLINAILGMNKPMSGKLSVLNENGKKAHVGFLPQRSEIASNFPATVGEVVLAGCLNRGGWLPFITKAQKALCESNMRLMQIEDLKKKPFGILSGGQKQRVLLARALCSAADGLILDEPTVGLDPMVTREMYRVINGLKDKGITVIMVSHDMDNALTLSDKILHVGHDKNFFGTPDEYKDALLSGFSTNGRFYG